jgi:hypothetical protein
MSSPVVLENATEMSKAMLWKIYQLQQPEQEKEKNGTI